MVVGVFVILSLCGWVAFLIVDGSPRFPFVTVGIFLAVVLVTVVLAMFGGRLKS